MPPREETGQNSWTEYRQLVMQSLDSLSDEIKGTHESLSSELKEYRKDIDVKFDRLYKRFNEFELQMTVDITTLKAKAAIWGGIFGAVVGAVVSALIDILIQNKLSH